MSSSTPEPPELRPQYHFFPGPQGLDAWSVARLVELSRELPVHEVALSEIAELDSAYWAEGNGAPPTVREIAEHAGLILAADLGYPIILGADGRVMDGMHRVAKALLEGRAMIAAVRFTVTPEPDYSNCRPADLPY